MNLYSDEMKQLLHTIVRSGEFPTGLIIDVIEYEDYLALRFHRDNFERFSGVDKERIAHKIGSAMYKMRQSGCPTYFEVVKGDGRHVSAD